MSASEGSDYELLTEHLGYPPVALLDDIINTVNVLADRALDSVERLLLSISPSTLGFSASRDSAATAPHEDAAKLEIEIGTHQLETLLNASIDRNFDLFELYVMNNVLTVGPQDRPHIRLAHYDGLDFSAAASPDHPTLQTVTALRRRLHASLKLQLRLEQETAKNEALLGKLRAALGIAADHRPDNDNGDEATGTVKTESERDGRSAFGFLRDRAGLEQGGADSPITTTTNFALSQLQALRSLSTSLRTILPDVQADIRSSSRRKTATAATSSSSSSSPPSSSTWRRDRVEYVETASRKYLENVAGLELGPQGEVRDGEWQGEGRQLSKAEVDSLERVAALMGPHEAGGEERGPGRGGGDDAGGG